jgi:hypothetical protein
MSRLNVPSPDDVPDGARSTLDIPALTAAGRPG